MPAATAITGAILGGIGSKKQADAQKKAANAAAEAAKFNPFAVNSAGGQVNWLNGRAIGTLSPEQQALYSMLGANAQGLFGGNSATAGFQDWANQLGGQGVPQLFGQAVDASNMLPEAEYAATQGGLGLLGQQFGALGNALASQGLGAIEFDPSQIVADRLSLLRQQAAPQEEAAGRALEQRLFSQGRLGTTGGSQNIEAFARGLGQADLARQIEAQNLGLTIQQMNQGLGTNLLSQAQGLFGNQGNLLQQQFTNAGTMSDVVNSRAQQRLQNAMGLFGFGQDLNTADFNQALQTLGAQQSIDQNLQNIIALGANIGGMQSSAGANVARAILSNSGSPTGSFLSGLGSGLFSAGMERFSTPKAGNANSNYTFLPNSGFIPVG